MKNCCLQRCELANRQIGNKIMNGKILSFLAKKRFKLDHPDGFKYYWHELTKKDTVSMSHNFSSVMIWAIFCFNGKTPMCFITTKKNARNYEDTWKVL